MQSLIDLFASHATERTTLDELRTLTQDRGRWPTAHDLFDRIRAKTNAAYKRSDDLLVCQYQFEEVCAKTLYNLSMELAPFDPDSPFWIVPDALILAKRIGIDQSAVIKIVSP